MPRRRARWRCCTWCGRHARLGLKARSVESSTGRLSRLALPAIAEMRGGGFVVLARADNTRVLVQEGVRPPLLLGIEEFGARWTGRLVLLARRAALAGAERKFDLTWFIPPVVKYRRLFGEVLLVSFFLQLFALVTPLFFQVVIDKVLVHRGLITLDVLVIGLVAITAFEIVLRGSAPTCSRTPRAGWTWSSGRGCSGTFSACRSRTSSPDRWDRPWPGCTSSRPSGTS